jgi:hypothetical protein
MRSASKKVLVVSTALGVVALGTGVSLAATQGSAKAQSVTCILVVDASAAADANSALSDVFAVGTKLHMTSAGRAVDVTVSGPITAAAPPSASASASPSPTASASPTATASASASAPASASASATASATASAGAGGKGGHTTGKGGHKKERHRKPAKKTLAPSVNAAVNAVKAANAGKAPSATKNDGVDPNTVCAELSKNAFNTLGASGNGANVGAFIATMTPVAADASSSAAAKQ